jgi:PAS domain-containing protein
MFLNISRFHTQLISFSLFTVGAIVLICGGWSNEFFRSIGILCMAGSIWFVMMSESILLGKVQAEMSGALESLRKKQETDIQDLLYFLKQEKITASPFESIEGAKRLCNKIHYPAMVLTTNHQIIKANKKMHDLLGWGRNELYGKPAHLINDTVVMSKIGELCAKPPHSEKTAMTTQYVYIHKDGTKIFGQMDALNIGGEGFLVVFHPEDECIISRDEIREIVV